MSVANNQEPDLPAPVGPSLAFASRPTRDYIYDIAKIGHYGACARLASTGFAPSELYTGHWTNIHQGLTDHYKDILTAYWQHMINQLEAGSHDFKVHQLPLARIKKVMKSDPEVKMISAEAPILFAKACDIFITELTIRAWIHAEESKRRTLQRSDIASALSKSDMFDFLIDIVPREEISGQANKRPSTSGPPHAAPSGHASVSQLPSQLVGMGHASDHSISSHPMGPDYIASHGALGAEQDFRPTQSMYPGQLPPPQPSAYGQTQPAMYGGEIDGMYQYSLPSQQAPMPSEDSNDKIEPSGW